MKNKKTNVKNKILDSYKLYVESDRTIMSIKSLYLEDLTHLNNLHETLHNNNLYSSLPYNLFINILQYKFELLRCNKCDKFTFKIGDFETYNLCKECIHNKVIENYKKLYSNNTTNVTYKNIDFITFSKKDVETLNSLKIILQSLNIYNGHLFDSYINAVCDFFKIDVCYKCGELYFISDLSYDDDEYLCNDCDDIVKKFKIELKKIWILF